MSYYSKEDFEYDFIARTKKNLEFIENRYKQEIKDGKKDSEIEDVFEVTQLINSFFGLLILPKERYFEFMNKDFDESSDAFEIIQRLIKDPSKYCNTYLDRSDGGRKIYNRVEQLTAKTLALRLRNASGHARFAVFPRYENHKVRAFEFKDKKTIWGIVESNTNTIKECKSEEKGAIVFKQSFRIVLTVEEIRIILFELCDLLLDHYN